MRETILVIILFKHQSKTIEGGWMDEITLEECLFIENLFNFRAQAKKKQLDELLELHCRSLRREDCTGTRL